MEYMLLRNYKENSLPARGLLLRFPFVTLYQIESDSWNTKASESEESKVLKFSDSEKRKIRTIIQIDIISKIMMYIEDLVIFAESLKQERTFYEFLDKKPSEKDLGQIIEDFFKNLDSCTDEDFLRIMSYADPVEIKLDKECIELLKKYIRANIDEVRRILKQIGDFGKSNHSVFRRFKHAGFPVIFNMEKVSGSTYLDGFDSYMLVLKGSKPMEDVLPVPYSKEVLDGHRIIIKGIQTLLKDIVDNRIACIERRIKGLIPLESYAPNLFKPQEIALIGKKVDDFLTKNPFIDLPSELKFDTSGKKQDIQWYLTLPEFLESCRKRAKLEEEFTSKMKE